MRLSTAFLAAILAASVANAQPVPSRAPSSTHIFPAGARRGETVEVRVGAECLPPGSRLQLIGEGVAAVRVLKNRVAANYELSPRRLPQEIPISYPKEWRSKINVAADAGADVALWRLSCAQGGTAARPFLIGDLPEFIETESNSAYENAENVTIPVTINGQIAGERDQDYYRFHADKGAVVSIDLVAGRLGSPLDPVLELRAGDGRPVDCQEIHRGSDPVLVFRASSADDYTLRVTHLGVGGGPSYVYRITITDQPFTTEVYPAGARAGKISSFSVFQADGSNEPVVSTREIELAADVDTLFWNSTPGANRVPIRVGAHSQYVESRSNDRREAAEPLQLPVWLNGRFETKSDEDWFSFEAEADKSYSVLGGAEPFRNGCFPEVALVDASGKVVAESKAIESTRSVCQINYKCGKAQTLFIRARDLQQGVVGGPRLIYRIKIAESRPDFQVELASDFANVVQGQTTKLAVSVLPEGGFRHDVIVEIDGLPDGIEAKPLTIPAGKTSGELVVSANDSARSQDLRLQIKGTASVGGEIISRVARARHLGVDEYGVSVGSPTTTEIQLTIQHKPIFRLHCSEAYRYAHRGTLYPYPMTIERLNGFKGDVILQIGDRQNRDLDGIEMREITLSLGQEEFDMPIFLPETMHINVQSQSQLYTQAYATFRDRWGDQQSLLVVSEKRNMIRTMPTVVQLKPVHKEMAVSAGESFDCALELERTTNFVNEMAVVLVDPPEGVTAAPAVIPAGAESVTIPVSVSTNRPESQIPLRFRATGKMPGYLAVITEASITLNLAK